MAPFTPGSPKSISKVTAVWKKLSRATALSELLVVVTHGWEKLPRACGCEMSGVAIAEAGNGLAWFRGVNAGLTPL